MAPSSALHNYYHIIDITKLFMYPFHVNAIKSLNNVKLYYYIHWSVH